MPKTFKELGEIITNHRTPEEIRQGYNVDPLDVEEVGRQALYWQDINSDGTLN